MPDINSALPFSGLWFIVPDYDYGSRDFTCAVSGTSKRPGDVGVFRPALDIGFVEGEGTFDISQAAIEDAAALLGWKSPAQVEAELADLKARIKEHTIRRLNDGKRIKALEAQVEADQAKLALYEDES